MTQKNEILIYGANGYTGRLITQQAKTQGLSPVLCGRNRDALKAISEESGLSFSVADLADEEKLCAALDRAKVVIHCAGPFFRTAEIMARACIRTGSHYLDITGEYRVFETLAGYHEKAKAAGVMLMPGAGFDVVPSDCLAAHLKNRLPDATDLRLAFTSLNGGVSRGTAKTMIHHMGEGTAIRKDHRIILVPPGLDTETIDFGDVKTAVVAISWGDVATAYRSTGIPNIMVYMGMPPKMIKKIRMAGKMGWLLRRKWVRQFLENKIDRKPPGPSEKRRAGSVSYLWGKVTDPAGNSKISTLKTPDGYSLTAMTAVESAKRILAGDYKAGYQTPATAFGADYILAFDGCERTDADPETHKT